MDYAAKLSAYPEYFIQRIRRQKPQVYKIITRHAERRPNFELKS